MLYSRALQGWQGQGWKKRMKRRGLQELEESS
jgi:hypothetical protein